MPRACEAISSRAPIIIATIGRDARRDRIRSVTADAVRRTIERIHSSDCACGEAVAL